LPGQLEIAGWILLRDKAETAPARTPAKRIITPAESVGESPEFEDDQVTGELVANLLLTSDNTVHSSR
jgi:hypothetical protein